MLDISLRQIFFDRKNCWFTFFVSIYYFPMNTFLFFQLFSSSEPRNKLLPAEEEQTIAVVGCSAFCIQCAPVGLCLCFCVCHVCAPLPAVAFLATESQILWCRATYLQRFTFLPKKQGKECSKMVDAKQWGPIALEPCLWEPGDTSWFREPRHRLWVIEHIHIDSFLKSFLHSPCISAFPANHSCNPFLPWTGLRDALIPSLSAPQETFPSLQFNWALPL